MDEEPDRAAVGTPGRDGSETAAWRRAHACSGVTAGLILAYVEREAGRDRVTEMLGRAGLAEREAELRDENSWFSFDDKIALWKAAQAVTGDARIAERAGESALDLSVGRGLKQALRALGSPEFLFRNIARATSKFNWAHTFEVVERDSGWVRLAYRDVAGIGYHHYDCEYATGLLRTVPQLFGLPAARVSQPRCGARGDEHCEFAVTWATGLGSLKLVTLAGGAAAAALVAVGMLFDPVVAVLGLGLGGLTSGLAGVRATGFMRRRIAVLEGQVREHGVDADAQLESLALLTSELRLDKALERITASASTSIGGAQFALLIAEVESMRAETHSGIPPRSLARLVRWAHENQRTLREEPIILDDLEAVARLRPLTDDRDLPLGSACVAPLVFHDRLLGVLLALAPGPMAFLPADLRALEIYAGHAAVALWNARLVERLEREAAEDSLTGLANRRAFDLACARELDRGFREGLPVSLVVFDIDHFKQINDTYGHPFGDQTLVAVATLLRSVVRGHDTVARIGGEEFALLLPGATLEDAHEVAERARGLLATIVLPHGALSCSAGVAVTWGSPGADPLAEADRALYEAKRQGRDRTVVADP